MGKDQILETVERMERAEEDRRSVARPTPDRRSGVVGWVRSQNHRDIEALRVRRHNQQVMQSVGTNRVVVGIDFADNWGDAR